MSWTCSDLKISSDQNAAVAGLPSGYLQKVIGSRPVKKIGAKSFGPILGLLGVRLLMIVDAEACERYGKRLRTRTESLVRDKAWHVVLTRKFLQKAGRKGGLARTENLTPAEAAQGSVPARPHTALKFTARATASQKRLCCSGFLMFVGENAANCSAVNLVSS